VPLVDGAAGRAVRINSQPPRRIGGWVTLFVCSSPSRRCSCGLGYGSKISDVLRRSLRAPRTIRSLSPSGFVWHGYGIFGTSSSALTFFTWFVALRA